MVSEIDPLYLLLVLPAIATWLVQSKVRTTHKKYQQISSTHGKGGMQVARQLLTRYGLEQVTVERTSAKLGDHYDPQNKVLRISEDRSDSNSLTALGIIAHEVGHAVQDAQAYRFLHLRNRLAQPVTILGRFSPWFYIGGFWYGITSFMILAMVMLVLLAVFALVTLPVERDASRRAETMLLEAGLIQGQEVGAVRSVLRAAAYTYLANLGRRIATFLFFVGVIGAGQGFIS
jgi:Zn-dependent membrane protease YugP